MKLNPPAISVEKNKLYITLGGDKKTIEFPYAIGEIEIFDDCIIIMIDPPIKTTFNENIYSVSYDGNILWQIILDCEQTKTVLEEVALAHKPYMFRL